MTAENEKLEQEVQEKELNATTTEECTGTMDEVSNELKQLTEKMEQLNDSYLRLRAEYDNYRKRTLKEKAELIKNGGETALTAILPVVDDFQRAIEVLRKSDANVEFVEGVELIYNKFQGYLKQNGVTPMDVVGQPFDSDLHEAITAIPAPQEDLKGKVIDCVQTGYVLNEKVIRFAKVVVGE